MTFGPVYPKTCHSRADSWPTSGAARQPVPLLSADVGYSFCGARGGADAFTYVSVQISVG